LKEAADSVGANLWKAEGPDQMYFLETFGKEYSLASLIPDVKVTSKGDLMSALFDLAATWHTPGEAEKRTVDGTEYDYAKFIDQKSRAPKWSVPPAEFLPPVSPATNDNLVMSWDIQKGAGGEDGGTQWARLFGHLHAMMISDEAAPKTPLELLKLVDRINCEMERKPDEVDCWLPMVDHKFECSLPWLNGMKAHGPEGTFPILGNAWKMRLRLDEVGVRAEAGGSLLGCLPPEPQKPELYVFDRPFLVWITADFWERYLDGVDGYYSKPVFAAYIDTADWKNPNIKPTQAAELKGQLDFFPKDRTVANLVEFVVRRHGYDFRSDGNEAVVTCKDGSVLGVNLLDDGAAWDTCNIRCSIETED